MARWIGFLILIVFFNSTAISNAQTKNFKEYYHWNKKWGSGFSKAPVKKERRIRELQAHNYSDTIFPDETISKFKHLKELKIFGARPNQKLKFDTVKLKELNKLQSITFVSFDLSKFPLELTRIDSLKELHLSFCNVKQLPNEISMFKKITRLELRGNYLNTLPDSIINIPDLETLDLGNNLFENIPEVVLQIKKLKYFYCTNPETQMPESYFDFKNKIYKISNNKIDVIANSKTLFSILNKETISKVLINADNCDARKTFMQSIDKMDIRKKIRMSFTEYNCVNE